MTTEQEQIVDGLTIDAATKTKLVTFLNRPSFSAYDIRQEFGVNVAVEIAFKLKMMSDTPVFNDDNVLRNFCNLVGYYLR